MRSENDLDSLIFVEADPCKIINHECLILHSYFQIGTLEILNFLLEHRWLPIATELNVWDAKTHVAGAIDLLVQNSEGGVLLMELKNGFEDNNYEPTDKDPWMRAPFTELRDCHKHRHLVQLLMQALILYNGYEQFQPDSMMILRSLQREKTVKVELLDSKWARSKYAAVTELLERDWNKQLTGQIIPIVIPRQKKAMTQEEAEAELSKLAIKFD